MITGATFGPTELPEIVRRHQPPRDSASMAPHAPPSAAAFAAAVISLLAASAAMLPQPTAAADRDPEQPTEEYLAFLARQKQDVMAQLATQVRPVTRVDLIAAAVTLVVGNCLALMWSLKHKVQGSPMWSLTSHAALDLHIALLFRCHLMRTAHRDASLDGSLQEVPDGAGECKCFCTTLATSCTRTQVTAGGSDASTTPGDTNSNLVGRRRRDLLAGGRRRTHPKQQHRRRQHTKAKQKAMTQVQAAAARCTTAQPVVGDSVMGFQQVAAMTPTAPMPPGAKPAPETTSCGHADDAEVCMPEAATLHS